ncbi:MAG: hypothetical protein Q7R51_00925 [bacterium]|nr:hypothetical protein [bacterium]
MAKQEQESHLENPVTIKKPTILDLSRLLSAQRKDPNISLTYIVKIGKTTSYDVIECDTTGKLTRGLERLDPFTQLRGGIIVHESPKK